MHATYGTDLMARANECKVSAARHASVLQEVHKLGAKSNLEAPG